MDEKVLSERNLEVRLDPLRENDRRSKIQGDSSKLQNRWMLQYYSHRELIFVAIEIGMMEREWAAEMRENSSQIDSRGCVS